MLQLIMKSFYFTMLLNGFNDTVLASHKIKKEDLQKLMDTKHSYVIYAPTYINFYNNIPLGRSLAYHAGVITKHGIFHVNNVAIQVCSIHDFLKHRPRFFLVKPRGNLDEIHKNAEEYINNDIIFKESFNACYNCEYFLWEYICKDRYFMNNYSQYAKIFKIVQCLSSKDYLFCKEYLDNKEYEITYYEII